MRLLLRNTCAGLFLILLAFSASCFQSQYLMPGLTLPAGSKVVSKTDSTTSSGNNPLAGMGASGMPGMPSMGNVEKTVMVNFDNPGGWIAVSSHFDTFMTSQGYSETFQSMMNMAGSMPGGNSQMSSMFQGMRGYFQMGKKYSVMLMDNSAMLGGAGIPAGAAAGTPFSGQFTLTVMRYQ